MNNFEREDLINIVRSTPLPANGGRNREWYLTRMQSTAIVNSIASYKKLLSMVAEKESNKGK